jgi:mannose-1-phosphate guanylyltransferase/mannose-6-phosphate isomerase
MGVFPADHLITREDRLRRYAEAAYQSAETNDVVVLGIQPRWAETGYGYIEFPKDVAPGSGETIRVVSFREKPDSKTAARFVEAGNFFWNAGMFFWRAARVLDLMREHLPKTADLISRLPGLQSGHFESALTDLYPQCENISIDYAVIEKAKNVSGIPLDDIGWNDVGSWDAVYELAQKDEQGNANTGEVLTLASSGNYVSAQKLVALVGVDHLVVVDTPDALLVVNRSKAQDVSKIVKLLEAQNREELL